MSEDGDFRRLIVHDDSALLAIAFAANVSYLPGLAPSDFSLFRHMKGRLRGESFETGERLLSVVEDIFGSLEKSPLTKVFLEWMTRLERCIEINGDYVWYPQMNILVVIGFKRWVSRSSIRFDTYYNATKDFKFQIFRPMLKVYLCSILVCVLILV
jgi:hypothetical protein